MWRRRYLTRCGGGGARPDVEEAGTRLRGEGAGLGAGTRVRGVTGAGLGVFLPYSFNGGRSRTACSSPATSSSAGASSWGPPVTTCGGGAHVGEAGAGGGRRNGRQAKGVAKCGTCRRAPLRKRVGCACTNPSSAGTGRPNGDPRKGGRRREGGGGVLRASQWRRRGKGLLAVERIASGTKEQSSTDDDVQG